MLRNALIICHRYTGLGIALFLIIVGITGSILVWHEELDSWLNPHWFIVDTAGQPRSAQQLIGAFKAQRPQADISFINMPMSADSSVHVSVINYFASDGLTALDQVFLDPVSGDILGARNTRNPGLNRGEIIRWIYVLHYKLTLGNGVMIFMGWVSMVWLFNCFIGFYLTLPLGAFRWSKWKKAWKIRPTRFNYDWHRATGLWLWPLMAMLAFTGVYFNISAQVVMPVLKAVTEVTRQPFEEPPLKEPLFNPVLDWDAAIGLGADEMRSRDIAYKLQYVGYYPYNGYYLVGFDTEHKKAEGVVGTQVYVDGRDRSIISTRIVGEGKPGDTFLEWQFPLHSGKAFGLVNRIIIFLTGLAVAASSVTGVLIWWRKRRARAREEEISGAGAIVSSPTV